MIEVLRVGSSTICVREDLAPRAILCETCKGFGEVPKTLYKSNYGEPFRMIYEYEVCPTCKGNSISYFEAP